MINLRPAVKNGGDIIAQCPINSICSSLPEEDGGSFSECGYLCEKVTSKKGLKIYCRYPDMEYERQVEEV